MSAAVNCKEPSLSYDLLLKMSSEQQSELPSADADDASTADSKADDASTTTTAEPETPCNSSIVESIATVAPTRENTMILRNVVHQGPNMDPKMAELIRQTRELSQLVFDEDSLTKVTKKSGWKVSFLATKDLGTLCGFAIIRITNGALSIAKIAIPVEFRGLGFGKLLMEEEIKNAKKNKDVYEVALSSLATAVTFYQRLGFKALTAVKVKTDFEVEEGQVYMVKKLRPRPKGK
jgi:ribosomal protein S18 acetylase RimI-like enzyme